MNLCDSGHDEVCFDGRNCPFCAKIEDKDHEISELNAKIDTLQEQLAEAENRE